MIGLSAQTPPAFEVASIRRTTSGNQQGVGLAAPQPGGRFVAVGATLRRLVSGAYDDLQIVDGPAWIDSDRFDINARARGRACFYLIMRAMLRSLLADRFKLVTHTESREQPIYALSCSQRSQTGAEPSGIGCGVREGSAQLRAWWAGRTSRVW